MELPIESMRKLNEGPTEWKLRKRFITLNMEGDLTKERLECLSNCFVYSSLYGVHYPQAVMDELKRRGGHILDETDAPKIFIESAPPPEPKDDSDKFPTAEQSPLAVPDDRPSTKRMDGVEFWITPHYQKKMLRIAGRMFRPIDFVRGPKLNDFSKLMPESQKDLDKDATEDESSLCFPSLRSEAFKEMKTQLDASKSERIRRKAEDPKGRVMKIIPRKNPLASETKVKEADAIISEPQSQISKMRIPKKKPSSSAVQPADFSRRGGSVLTNRPTGVPLGFQSAKFENARKSSPKSSPANDAASKKTECVLQLRRLFDSWSFLDRKNNQQLNHLCTLNNAATKIQIILENTFDSKLTPDGCYVCRLCATKQKMGFKVWLSEGKARSKKEAKNLACVPLEKFRQRRVESSDLKVDDNDKNAFVLLHKADATPAAAARPSPAPARPTAQVAPSPAAPRPPAAEESSLPVFLKETCKDPLQTLSNTATRHGLPLDFETLPNSRHRLHFLGKVWGPTAEMPLPRAKRVLAETAVKDLRFELWTLRVRRMPDFSSLQAIVSVQKEDARDGGEEGGYRDGAPLAADNVGHRLLRQMGWTANTGLGRERDGRTVPVSAGMTLVRREGLGCNSADLSAKAFRGFVAGKLREYVNAGMDAEDLCFSSEFTNEERAFVHQECKRLPMLESRSFNTADGNRFLVVMKRRSPQQLLDWVRKLGGSTIRYEAFAPGQYPESQ